MGCLRLCYACNFVAWKFLGADWCASCGDNSPNDLFKKNQKVNDLFLNNALDCDKIVGEICIRTRNVGDKIKLNRRNGTKTLKKLYTEYSVPLSDRENLPVIADDEGVVWVYSIGVAERCAVSEHSKNIIKINVTIV